MSNFLPPSHFMEAMRPVVAQPSLLRKVAFAFSAYTLFLDDPSVGRPTPLIFGPSGSGKTFAIELCCEASNLPYTVIGGAGVSAAGYKGITLRDLLAQHYLRFRRSEGIIFVDEVDKWTRGGIRSNDAELVAMGNNKMSEMLRYVEREDVYLQDEAKDIAGLREDDPDAQHPEDEAAWVPVRFETKRAMWVMAGAFDGLHHVIKRRLQNETLVDEEQLWERAAPEDFRAYGLLSELVNRLDVQAWVKPLKGHEIMEILQAQEVPKLVRMFQAIGCQLDLDLGALAMAAHLAVQERTGARGAVLRLRHVVSDCYTEADAHKLAYARIDAITMQHGHLDLTATAPSPASQPVQPILMPLEDMATRLAV